MILDFKSFVNESLISDQDLYLVYSEKDGVITIYSPSQTTEALSSEIKKSVRLIELYHYLMDNDYVFSSEEADEYIQRRKERFGKECIKISIDEFLNTDFAD